MPDRYRVVATSLNLRSEPVVRPGNRLAVLPQGQLVTKLADSATAGWWQVSAVVSGVIFQGFVSARFLEPDGPAPAGVTAVAAVHMKEGRAEVTRASLGLWAFPIGEPGHPPRLTGNAAARAAGILAIIDWLDVVTGARWKKVGATTYCNIYAYDVCYLAGVYLPRVWWNAPALVRLGRGESVVPNYGQTIGELNANALCDWLEQFGAGFGWRRAVDADELQSAANAGRIAMIVAQNVQLNVSGHIQIVPPEHGTFVAKRLGGRVTQPLQSQAGSTNFRYGFNSPRWWAGPRFRKHGFWINES